MWGRRAATLALGRPSQGEVDVESRAHASRDIRRSIGLEMPGTVRWLVQMQAGPCASETGDLGLGGRGYGDDQEGLGEGGKERHRPKCRVSDVARLDPIGRNDATIVTANVPVITARLAHVGKWYKSAISIFMPTNPRITPSPTLR